MASTYSPNLRLELIGTGEQQGTWGATTNTNLGTLLEEAIGGYTSVTVDNAGDTTLTTANGAADQSRNMTINLTGTLTASRNVIVPAIEKVYLVKNATSGGFAVTVKVSGQTGVSVANGTTMLVFVDGTDVRQAGAQVGASNSLVLAAGSASAPSLTTTGDTNTGLCFPAADTLSASTGGTERMRIDSSGNVGIGAASTGSKLHVSNSGNTTARIASTDGQSPELSLFSAGVYDRRIVGGATLRFLQDSTEQMRIDASGNVGIGITPSAWSGLTALQIKGASIASSTRELSTQGNAYYNSGWKYIDTAAASRYLQSAGVHYWYTAASGTAGSAITFTERMQLDASGNVGIGLTPSGYRLQTLQTGGSTISANFRTDQTASYVSFRDTGNASDTSIRCGSNANSFVVLTDGSERTRVQSDGIYLVGKSSGDLGAVGCELRPDGIVSSTQTASTNSNSSYYLYSTGAAGYRFYVGLGGTVFAVSTTISAVSDQRLKENIRDLDVGLAAINQLKPRKFDWKPGKGQDIKNARGFIAQEFEQVFPDLIDTWKDPAPEGEEPYKSVRPDLIPVLVKAIQELSAKNDELALRIATLEAA